MLGLVNEILKKLEKQETREKVFDQVYAPMSITLPKYHGGNLGELSSFVYLSVFFIG